MSDAGEESSSSSDSEPETEKAEPIYAIAPSINIQDEGSIDVAASPAFQYLDELFSAGKLPGTRVAELKAKYTALHETVISLQESEIQLLQDAKRFTVEIEQQQQALEKADQFPEGFTSEVSRMRQQLLKYQNEYTAIKEREYELQYKLNSLQEDKRLLQREYERIPKQGETEKKMKAVKENCEELRKETIQRRMEIKALKEDVTSKQRLMLREQKEVEELLEQQDDLKDELVRLHAIPVQLGKEMDKIKRKTLDAEKKKKILIDHVQELNDALKKMEKKSEEVLEEKEDVMKELDGKRALLESKEREFNHLTKLLEMSKENEATALADRAVLEIGLRNCLLEKQKQHDNLIYKQREKDRDLRNLKKMEMQLKIAYDSMEQIKLLHERLTLEVDAIPKDDGTLVERRKDLQKEVEMNKRNLSQEKMTTDVEAHMLEQCIAEEDQLFKEQERCRDELARLARLTQVKADEREQKSKDFLKAQIRLHNIIKEIKTKELEIREYKKNKKEIQRQLKGFAKMYDIIRNERNKCVNLVHTARQKTTEIKERVKMLENEMEILRSNVIIKERKLQKNLLKHSNNIAIKDSIQSDVCKVIATLQEMKEKREQQLLDVDRLTNMLTHIEEEMVQLRKKYERAVLRRNESGVLLIEREEEVCIFYEKINIQEMMSRNGDIEIQVMDEKIRFLNLKLAEKKRQIELSLKMLPMKNALDADLVVLQIQYSQCKDRIKSLEKRFADPEGKNRKRTLEGKDPSLPELFKKIEELEIQLVQKEEKLLEKDFIYEQVSRLTDRLRTKTENGKEDTLILAKRMNEIQQKIKDKTQKMMALIAELSMKQAITIKLQQEMRDKEQFLLTVSSRIEKGLPPPKETEIEWMKVLRNEEMHKAAAEAREKRAAEEEQYALPNSIYTTAEQRPNAYIPDDENVLPLPRPYGALAPFKPTEPGSNMRHIRKPIVKPIEI
ncbi:coiled-coil domain-containing protein 146 isoform X1 [Malaclemys terrapin pileata]|uniref:coiled-coil domain-containing protein 146 isoform X1 n=2 Tax=Malaclemys terrapin pileata TaxID=2991368 RepID=UPI0023A79AF6|nr:coiled-coil domain-containing protein 146 isoform X1 [Malaclemys terrapin pileata]